MLGGRGELFDEELFERVVKTTAASAKLGIFAMECAHRQVQQNINSSAKLGRAKEFETVAAETFLGSIKQNHLSFLGRKILGLIYRFTTQVSVSVSFRVLVIVLVGFFTPVKFCWEITRN